MLVPIHPPITVQAAQLLLPLFFGVELQQKKSLINNSNFRLADLDSSEIGARSDLAFLAAHQRHRPERR